MVGNFELPDLQLIVLIHRVTSHGRIAMQDMNQTVIQILGKSLMAVGFKKYPVII